MKVLVTGASGFVGQHLLRNLLDNGHEIAITAPHPFTFSYKNKDHEGLIADLSNPKDCESLVDKANPSAIIHLAGMSHVQQSTEQRLEMAAGNISATLELFKAVYKTRKPCTIALASTAQMYKACGDHQETVVHENSEIELTLPYALSKLAAEYIARSFEDENLKIYIIRPFNHIGPGQAKTFVCPGFAERIKSAKDGDTIPVGNLAAKRDFTDVRDVVDVYRLVIEKRPKEKLFVVGTGRAATIKEVLEYFIRLSGKTIHTTVDQALMRSMDPPSFRADPSLAKSVLGWQPKYSLEQSLEDIYRSF